MAKRNNNSNKNTNLKKIRSKYIIIRIFDNIKQSKLMQIINYNKKYQKLMDLKLKDYKNEILKIEIEIIPKKIYMTNSLIFIIHAFKFILMIITKK